LAQLRLLDQLLLLNLFLLDMAVAADMVVDMAADMAAGNQLL
jgi:hypothetical protein